MYQSSAEFDALVMQDCRTFSAKFVVDGVTEITEGIRSLRLYGGSNSANTFVLGAAISQYIEVELANPPQALEGHELKLLIGIEGSEEWIPCGFYAVQKPQTDEGQIKFNAYDRMLLTERAYFSSLPAQTNTLNVLNEIGTFLGLTIVTAGLNSIAMAKPVGYTCREVLCYIAQMYGGFVICNRSGQIEIKTFKDSGYRLGADRYWGSFKHNDFPFILQKIVCYTGKDTDENDLSITVGGGARSMTFSNPFMTQVVLNGIWGALKNYTYMPGELKVLGDPRLDPWDVVTVVGTDGVEYRVPLMSLKQDFDGGLTTDIKAVGWTEKEQESGFSGPVTQAIDRMAVELMLVNHAVINKLDVDTANITFAKITELDAINAQIQNLDVIYAKVTDLKVTNAQIQNLDANYANIENLLSGNGGVGDLVNIHLTSENAVIDTALIKNLISSNISVNDLMAGIIYTSKMQIWNDESGGMKMVGSTLQWTDKNKVVRMQAGLDAQGIFNYYILDSTGAIMFDALNGISSHGIKNPVIVNDMVAENANISAGKLDVKSLETVINRGDIRVQSSVIKLDVSGQTLDLALSQLHDEINAIVVDDGTYVLQTWVEGGHVGDNETATIQAKVYVKNSDVTETIPPERFLWTRYSEYADEDEAWNSQQRTGYALTLSGADVTMVAEFQCLLTIAEEYSIETLTGNVITNRDGAELLALYVKEV